jgi:hypothetical protein
MISSSGYQTLFSRLRKEEFGPPMTPTNTDKAKNRICVLRAAQGTGPKKRFTLRAIEAMLAA